LRRIGNGEQKVRQALGALWLSRPLAQNTQVQVALALCKLNAYSTGAPRFLAQVLVSHQVATLRQAAAEGLGWCSKSEVDVVPALLVAALNDKDEEVRQIARASLKELRLSDEKAIQLCAKQLKESLHAEAALRNSGPVAVPALIEALRVDEFVVREKAARLLGRLGELAVAAVPELTAALRDKHAEFRLAAAKGLWNITKNAEAVVPVLVDLLKEKWVAAQDGVEVRRQFLQTVIEALQRIGPPAEAAIPALNGKRRDKNRLVGESAHRALEVIAPAVARKVAR
jgi:hypothetical protein